MADEKEEEEEKELWRMKRKKKKKKKKEEEDKMGDFCSGISQLHKRLVRPSLTSYGR